MDKKTTMGKSDLNKKWFMAFAVALAVATVFIGLWVYEKNDNSEIEQLCQINASQALSDFRKYEDSHSEGDYWQGVSNFKAFLNTWLTIEERSSAEYLWCNSVYGFMVLQPEKVQQNMDKVLDALEIIGSDYTHPSGYLKIQELDNILKHE